ncbi:hypothetical protein JHD50_07095 [Sulfurimonas sp. MAG313]|nr:hypothetical protein [Sulfurimonas sp. MAG313]MDF1881072.1 hypothetical protein [Sulfurimonas sp. MAG313]
MKLFMLMMSLLLLSACSFKSEEELFKRVKINGLICPEGFSTHQVKKDLSECQYYDQKKAAEAAMPSIKPECVSCLEKKGYKLQ